MSSAISDSREKDTLLFMAVKMFPQDVAALLKNKGSVQSNIMAG